MYSHSSIALKMEMRAVEERFGLHRRPASARSVSPRPTPAGTRWMEMLAGGLTAASRRMLKTLTKRFKNAPPATL